MTNKILFDPNEAETKKRLEIILDSFMDTLSKDEAQIFGGDRQRKGFHFRAVQSATADWESSKDCLFPGCGQPSIANSHTIPKGSLKLIANIKTKEVLTVIVDPATALPKFEKVHVGNASLFPGFCKSHENSFSEFEMAKELVENEDLFLQAFRTACRELRNRENLLKSNRDRAATYRDKYQAWSIQFITEKMKEHFENADEGRFKSVTFNLIEDKLKPLDEAALKIEKHIKDLKENFLNSMFQTFDTHETDLTILHQKLDYRFPMALAGRGSIWHPPGEKNNEELDILINLFPEKSGSSFIIVGRAQDNEALKSYFQEYRAIGKIGMVLMAEAWMLYGSDHWFINPDVVGGDLAKAAKIFEGVMSDKGNCRTKPNFSIFDQLRKEGIADFEKHLRRSQQKIASETFDAFSKFVEAEKRKLSE